MSKKSVLVSMLLAPVAVVAVTIPVMSAASAQSNSRICGNYWYSDAPSPSATAPDRMKRLMVARYMEVYKGDFLSCDHVLHKTDNNPVPQDYPDWASFQWSDRAPVSDMECEQFTKDILLYSVKKPGTSEADPDVCEQMNKANSMAEVDSQNSHQNRMWYYYCAASKKYNATSDTCD